MKVPVRYFALLVDGFHSSVSAVSFVNCQESVNYKKYVANDIYAHIQMYMHEIY